MKHHAWLAGLVLFCFSLAAAAQKNEPISAAVRAALHQAIGDLSATGGDFSSAVERAQWLTEMSRRLKKKIPDDFVRMRFLQAVHYEAVRAGLDPQLVLALIQVESGFRKYAISGASARGYMQVMPFWPEKIGDPHHDLFQLRTNLRYGCTILRYYLQLEHGDAFRALGRYNGSLGHPEYPQLVYAAWHSRWEYPAAAAGRTRPRLPAATANKPLKAGLFNRAKTGRLN